jgi:hypothetical protein
MREEIYRGIKSPLILNLINNAFGKFEIYLYSIEKDISNYMEQNPISVANSRSASK